jgi:hypothetical protein
MSRPGLPFSAAETEGFCNQLYTDWRGAYSKNDYTTSVALVNDFVKIVKPLYNNRSFGETDMELYTFLYVFLILAKGLGDVAELAQNTQDSSWSVDNTKTEAVWYQLWDAKERLDYFQTHCLEPGFVANLQSQLNELENFFYDAFGRGIYASPEIIIKKATCNVCGLNIKGCCHIPGNVYGGIPCKEKVEDMEFRTISLVQNPHDMRCRMWQWNMTPDMRVSGRFMNLETIDTFITES